MTHPTHFWGRGDINAAALSHDGSVLAVCNPIGVHILDPSTIETRRVILCERELLRIAIDDNGSVVVAGSNKNYLKRLPAIVRSWEVDTGEQLEGEHPKPIEHRGDWRVQSHDGMWTAEAGERGAISIVDKDGDVTQVITPATQAAFACMGFNTDGALVTVTREAIIVWDIQTGAPLVESDWPQNWIRSLTVRAGGEVDALCAVKHNSVQQLFTFTLRDGALLGPPIAKGEEESGRQRLAREFPMLFSSDGSLKIPETERGKSTPIVDIPRGMLSALPPGHERTIVTNGDRVATVHNKTVITVHDANTAHLINQFETKSPIKKLALDASGSLLAATLSVGGHPDATIQMWDVNTAEELAFGIVHGWTVSDITFSPKQSLLATCSYDRKIRFWTPRPMSLVAEYTGHAAEIHAIAFHPEEQFIVSGGTDGSVRWWPVPQLTQAAPEKDE